MKLNRDNFIKMEYEGGMLYQYVCNETDFFLYVKGKGDGKQMSVFKGNVDNRQEEFTTNNTLEAWNKFEEYLTICEPQQGSSGGFARNPQQDPSVLPLLAIKRLDSGAFKVALFAQLDETQQVTAYEFEVSSDALTYPFPTKVFVVDWKDEEIPSLFRCEVLLKKYSDVEYQEDSEMEVFLFIPKSIINQGGEEGGDTSGGEGGDEVGDETGGTDEGSDEGGEDGGDGGQPTDQPSDEEPDDETDTDSQQGTGSGNETPSDTPRVEPQPLDFGETINALADITGTQQSTVNNVFRTVANGALWLSVNNFDNIKRQLNLPASTTATQLSQQIINSK
jgi:hypothetical protein